MSACPNCGFNRDKNLLECRFCGYKPKLSDTLTNSENLGEPPVEIWARELKEKSKPSEESLKEVMREAKERSRPKKNIKVKKKKGLGRIGKRRKKDFNISDDFFAEINNPSLGANSRSRLYSVTVFALLIAAGFGTYYFPQKLIADAAALPLGIAAFSSLISLIAFAKPKFYSKILFVPTQVIRSKEIYRIITSGFGHVNFTHLIFNMYALISFGPFLMGYFIQRFAELAPLVFLVFYLSAVIAADLPDLIRNRKRSGFSSVGASGAISAVIAGAVLAEPNMRVTLIFLPPSTAIPGFLYIVIFVIISLYLNYKSIGKIAHVAHVSGTLYGLAILNLIMNMQSGINL